MSSSVFISYARGASLTDAQALKSALGDLAFLDTSGIDDGDQFQQRLLSSLLNCSVVVIFATGLFMERRYCRLEMRLALAGAASIVLALGEKCGDVLDALPTEVTGKNWPKADETSRLQKLVEKLLASKPPAISQLLTADQAQRIGEAFLEESKLPLPQPLPAKHSFPPGIASSSIGTRFVGRADLLPAIHLALSDGIGKSARLTGRIVAGGGFGKTRAAIEYLHRYASHYPGGIFWLDASNPDLTNEFWRILKELNPTVPDLPNMREQKRDVTSELRHALHSIGQSALYVVDNIMEAAPGESPKPISHFCPAIGAVAVLATSRQNNTEPGTIPVDTLERDSAILLLTSGVPASATLAWDDWGTIAKIVGDLPIALDLLNRSLVLSAITPARLLQQLQQPSPVAEIDRLSQALKGQVPEGAARGVTEAFLISYQLLDPTSKRLAQLLAQLEPAPIPEVFMDALPDELKSVRAAMRSRHFVTASDPPNALSFGFMHRLMADFLRNLTPSDNTKLLDEACGLLSRVMHQDLCRNPKYWPAMDLCSQHAVSMFTRSEGTAASASLGFGAAILAYAQGHLPAARLLDERALDMRTRLLGEDHPDTLTSMNNLAGTLKAQGDLPAARKLQEHVLKVMMRELGDEKQETLTVMSNLAETLRAQGDFPTARKLQEHVLELTPRVLGADHPNTLSSMNNLALTLKAQGDFAAAKKLQEHALKLMTNKPGEEHPNMLSTMNSLAATLGALGDHAAARKLQEHVLELRLQKLGEKHPSTLTSMNNLAETLNAQGDLTAARQLQERVLVLMTHELGEENPSTLTALNNLAITFYYMGDRDQAIQLLRKCLLGRRKRLGDKHPDTLGTAESLKIAEGL